MEAEQVDIEVILLGTGTSGQVPSIACLTSWDDDGCECCLSHDRKDLRRNTSAVLRFSSHPISHSSINNHSNPSTITRRDVLIDVGKSFCEAAREFFPRHHIRKLDAVLLTHPHADAINGLDDLRAWTLGGAIQESIAIYCNEYTHAEISRMHPYLVDSHAKTGGGDVPQFTWNIIRDGTAFNLFGIEILPLPVHHGKFFTANALDKPYICTSYLIDKRVYYVSDVSSIPEETFNQLEKSLNQKNRSNEEQNSSATGSLKVLIIDTLRLLPHASHFGIAQAISTAQRLSPVRTYLVGFTHRVTHKCWTHCCQAISHGLRSTDFEPTILDGEDEITRPMNESMLEKGIVENYDWFTNRALRLIEADTSNSSNEMPWVRPGFDGLVVQSPLNSSSVTDNYYH